MAKARVVPAYRNVVQLDGTIRPTMSAEELMRIDLDNGLKADLKRIFPEVLKEKLSNEEKCERERAEGSRRMAKVWYPTLKERLDKVMKEIELQCPFRKAK